MAPCATFYLFQRPMGLAHQAPVETLREDSLAHQGRRLLCGHCAHPITDEEEKIAIQGGHEHTYANPHGYMFHIGCFNRAPGCIHAGQATAENTWFAGHEWRIALCANCGAHLGWRFRNPSGAGFHGLILAQLVLERDT